MDPLNPESFTHKKAFVNGINLHYIDEGRDVNGVLILCHGFPDLWYGWRYQIKFLVQKGFQVLVPDLRGFGQSDAPRCPPNSFSAYSWKTIVTDLRDLMDALSIPRAIFIGHDWTTDDSSGPNSDSTGAAWSSGA
ncbi:Alpha/Beta hydrolase protein [Endogone sp. FLAS-F59071]|nr:Alpha/Beta hydrolase protein [Endogone sp. FLAS-F59071]|eukprot:RUS15895.1 Alpha/Beta hydrolase protein [Endogone sp. FLAS-F59071]